MKRNAIYAVLAVVAGFETQILAKASENQSSILSNGVLFDDGSGNEIFMQAPSSGMSASYDFTLPPDGGANGYLLGTDGTGETDWVNPSSLTPGVVVPGTSNGLVSSNGLTGSTSGSAIASGYVGEVLTSSNCTTQQTINVGGANFSEVNTLSIPAGNWTVSGRWYVVGYSGQTKINAVLTTTAAGSYTVSLASAASGEWIQQPVYVGSASADIAGVIGPRYINLSGTTTYRLHLEGHGNVGNGAGYGCIVAIRNS